MKFQRLRTVDGSWDKVKADWDRQCGDVKESIDDFAPETIAVLESFMEADDKNTWIVGLYDGTHWLAIAYLNRAMLPGTEGWTLRVRNVIVCPLLDYGAWSKEAYADTLVSFTWAVVQLSETALCAEHIKFHLRSPGDMAYFTAFGNALDTKGVFARVSRHGAWLAISKHGAAK